VKRVEKRDAGRMLRENGWNESGAEGAAVQTLCDFWRV